MLRNNPTLKNDGSRRRIISRIILTLLIGLVCVLVAWGSDYYSRVLAVIALAIIAACGLNILTGVTGQISLGHAGFYAVGAYVTALLTVKHGWPIVATIPIGIVITAVLGLVLAWSAIRLKGPYLTMVTIAFGMIIYGVATDFTSLTNGPEGLFPVPPFRLDTVPLNLQQTNLLLLLIVVLVLFLHASLIDGRFGRAMRAIRGNELAASSLGINVTAIKCLAFAISGVLAGISGMLYAPINGFVNPDSFTLELSVLLLMMVILGGGGTIWGPVAGAVILTLLDRALAPLGDIRLIVYGAILLLTLHLLPDGVVGIVTHWLNRASRQAHTSREEVAIAVPQNLEVIKNDSVLQLSAVTRAFGGLTAVDCVSFSVAACSIHGLVGPNGAGKTTVLNMISGAIGPSQGDISYGAFNVASRPMHVVAAHKIGRTFQNLALFPNMTVLENVLSGLYLSSNSSFLASIFSLPSVLRDEQHLKQEAMSLLRFVGLAATADQLAGSLPQGHQRLLEIARALAIRPKLLLLDEPAAGLNGTEVDDLILLIRRIRAAGVTVLLIEHHMQLVMAVCEKITVLDFGKLIADGTPREVCRNPKVVEAYLGKSASTVQDGTNA